MNSLFYFEILFVKNKLAGDVSFCFILFGNIPKYMLAVYYQCGLNGENCHSSNSAITTYPLSGAFSTLTMVPSFALILCEFG